MEDRKNIQIKSIKRDIYFEYLKINNLNEKYNMICVDSDGYNFLIPDNYKIDYSGSYNIYETRGHIYFYNDRYKYNIDYIKKDYQDYLNHMNKKEKYIIKRFNNYRNQEFIEVFKGNFDSIYMYYNGYYFKIYSDHKFSLNEYFDMYFIFFSINDKSISNNIELLKELYFFSKNSIIFEYSGKNILESNLREYTDQIDFSSSDIIVYNNDEYIKYKDAKSIAEKISLNILENSNNVLSVDYIDSKWIINGKFKFGNIWNFSMGYISDYNEIINSNDFSIDDKKKMLSKIIVEKKYSLDGYLGTIKKEFYSFLRDYMSRELSYDLWNEYHIREFVNFELINEYNESLNDFSLYKLYMSNIYSDIKIFNDKLVMDSIVPENITISPNIYILCISGLNGLLNKIKIKFDEEFNLIYK